MLCLKACWTLLFKNPMYTMTVFNDQGNVEWLVKHWECIACIWVAQGASWRSTTTRRALIFYVVWGGLISRYSTPQYIVPDIWTAIFQYQQLQFNALWLNQRSISKTVLWLPLICNFFAGPSWMKYLHQQYSGQGAIEEQICLWYWVLVFFWLIRQLWGSRTLMNW